jgi:hypothetical protein
MRPQAETAKDSGITFGQKIVSAIGALVLTLVTLFVLLAVAALLVKNSNIGAIILLALPVIGIFLYLRLFRSLKWYCARVWGTYRRPLPGKPPELLDDAPAPLPTADTPPPVISVDVQPSTVPSQSRPPQLPEKSQSIAPPSEIELEPGPASPAQAEPLEAELLEVPRPTSQRRVTTVLSPDGLKPGAGHGESLLSKISRVLIGYPPPFPRKFNVRENREAILQDLAATGNTSRYSLENFHPRKGESVIWSFNKVGYYRKISYSEYEGGSRGISIPIAKGIRYRVGASRGKSVRRSAIELQSRGTLVFTTAGFTFLSGTDSVRIPIDKILAVQPEGIGISLHLDYVRNPYAGFDRLSKTDFDFIKRAIDILRASPSSRSA